MRETSLVEFEVDTGQSLPKKQPARRVPYSACQKIANQLQKMQNDGVIQELQSSWAASPMVLVRKRDGSLRFCVDYRNLNSVTKPDLFPLPRIDDLLDNLGKARCPRSVSAFNAKGFDEVENIRRRFHCCISG